MTAAGAEGYMTCNEQRGSACMSVIDAEIEVDVSPGTDGRLSAR